MSNLDSSKWNNMSMCFEMEQENKTSAKSEEYSQLSSKNSFSSQYAETNSSKLRSRSKSMSHFFNEISSGDAMRIRERLLRTNSHLEPSAIKNFSRRQKLTLFSLALVDFMGFCSMSIMAPFFPREAQAKGLSETMTGFIFSFYALVMFISSPFFGKILPKAGAKSLFLYGILIAGFCDLIFGFLIYIEDPTLFTAMCLFVRGVEALGASAYSTASYVFVINSFPQNIASVLGILETFVGLGMSTGPALGGILYSLGGFILPFFVLGTFMVVIVPLNICLLPNVEDYNNCTSKSTSFLKLIKVSEVIIIGLVVVTISSCWAFLDPTLEPHLRKFNLTTNSVGLIFLLFSALYGLSSPLWGWVADKNDNHWSMMVIGLFMCTIGLLLLGPCPYIQFLKPSIWLIIVALSILGVSVALALLPTFQGILRSAVNAGHGDSLATYSVVAGVWSCMYSLGEVLGPFFGGILLQFYGFAFMSTVMATITLVLAIVTLVYYLISSSSCNDVDTTTSDSGINESWKSTNDSDDSSEATPLLYSLVDSNFKTYTEEKLQYYEQSRKHDKEVGDIDTNQLTDVRGTVAITGKGSCEV